MAPLRDKLLAHRVYDFADLIAEGMPWAQASKRAEAPAAAAEFMSHTLEMCQRWRLVKRAAEESLIARIKLWDGIAEAIEAAK